ncbi:ester cyclase [Polycladidibacter hongkongensis]|uniref:ester cyclase n=1 Tax=Polycladidibacter hongkongensis TaxID=1647556 RepID=UPI0008356790|nr:ester cyclase [Pseudovibrio hongkongensis]
MQDLHKSNKALLNPLRKALYDYDADTVCNALRATFAQEVVCRLSHPLGTMVSAPAYFQGAIAPLVKALPDLERRDYIVIAGQDSPGQNWVGTAGYYTGTFAQPFLQIPPTGHQVAMRFHEFYRFVEGKVVEIQAIWDIPELMMQAGAWPMAPSLGREWRAPAPATQDGINVGQAQQQSGQQTCKLIIDMLEYMIRHPQQGGPEVMQLERFWHPKMNWYGPAGIGTARGITGFRNWHQIPFLRAMPDRGQNPEGTGHHFFGEGNYAAVTGWPNMRQTLSHDGWLGLAPSVQEIALRSLDFWRVENGKIRENWVLVDLLDVYSQLGIDVFARMQEFNKAYNPFHQHPSNRGE